MLKNLCFYSDYVGLLTNFANSIWLDSSQNFMLYRKQNLLLFFMKYVNLTNFVSKLRLGIVILVKIFQKFGHTRLVGPFCQFTNGNHEICGFHKLCVFTNGLRFS